MKAGPPADLGWAWVAGTWSYQTGSSYRLSLEDHVVFEEQHADGREVRGVLLPEDVWLVGRLISDGDVWGTLMLRPADGFETLASFFQPLGTSGWVRALATRSGKAERVRSLVRPEHSLWECDRMPALAKSGASNEGLLEYEDRLDLTQESPLLRDCVLHSLRARVAYLEQAMHDEGERSVSRLGLGSERGKPKVRSLARSAGDDREAGQVVTGQEPVRRPGRGRRKQDQAVQAALEEAASPNHGGVSSAPTSPTSPGAPLKCSAHLRAILERQQRRCLFLADDVAMLAEDFGKLQSKPLAATGMWVSSAGSNE
ncbi:unnamed protein product [Effrenium voratum]|nr:unnamed protein product [Effrenium voratum]